MRRLYAAIEKHFHVVAQLRAAHYGVVAKKHAVAAQDCFVGNELHLGHQVAHFLVAGSEAARPRGGVFRNGAHVRLVHAGRIAVTHAHARVGDTAHAVGVHCFGLAHLLTAGKAHLLNVYALVARSREAVIHPQERAYLHFVVGFAQLLHPVCMQAHYLAGTEVTVNLISEIGKRRSLACHCIRAVFPAYHHRRAAQFVACGHNAVFRKQQHGARAFNTAEHVLYAVHKAVALHNEQGNDFRLVGLAR